MRSPIEVVVNQAVAATVGCCRAGREAYPDPCPWHPEGLRPMQGFWPDREDDVEDFGEYCDTHQAEMQDHDCDLPVHGEGVVDVKEAGHEVVGQPPATSERPPGAPPRSIVNTYPIAVLEKVQRALGLDSDSTEEMVLDRIQDLKIGRSEIREGEHAALRVRLGLPETARWVDILAAVEAATAPGTQQMDALRRRMGLRTDTNWLGILLKLGRVVEVANRWGAVCDALGLDHTTGDGGVVAEIERLQRADESMNPPDDPADREMTMEESERQRQQRQEALHTVMDLWSQHRLGEDPPSAEDLVALSSYLSTGDITLAQDVQRQRLAIIAEERRRYEREHQGAPDAARWTGQTE